VSDGRRNSGTGDQIRESRHGSGRQGSGVAQEPCNYEARDESSQTRAWSRRKSDRDQVRSHPMSALGDFLPSPTAAVTALLGILSAPCCKSAPWRLYPLLPCSTGGRVAWDPS
jgi:hypothetical protein